MLEHACVRACVRVCRKARRSFITLYGLQLLFEQAALLIFINRLHSRIDPSLRADEYLTLQSIQMYLRQD